MSPEDKRSGPATGRPDTTTTSAIVTDRRAAERSRRSRRWARRNLDDLLLHEPPSSITTADVLSLTVAPAWLRDTGCVRLHDGDCDFWGHCTGMNLGHPERRAAGLALLERGWVA